MRTSNDNLGLERSKLVARQRAAVKDVQLYERPENSIISIPMYPYRQHYLPARFSANQTNPILQHDDNVLPHHR